MDEKTKGKQRIALLLPAQLLHMIDKQAAAEGITRTKYVIRSLTGGEKKLVVNDQIDAVRLLINDPVNWKTLPIEYQTKEVFKALLSFDPKTAAAITDYIPTEWWNGLGKEEIVVLAAHNTQILRNLPPKYRRSALSYIRQKAKTAWEEYDKSHGTTKNERKITSPKGKRDRKPPRSKKTSPQKTGLPSGPDLFDGLQ